MATISLDIPNGKVDRVAAAIAPQMGGDSRAVSSLHRCSKVGDD